MLFKRKRTVNHVLSSLDIPTGVYVYCIVVEITKIVYYTVVIRLHVHPDTLVRISTLYRVLRGTGLQVTLSNVNLRW